jgi:hypothetical protein
MTRCVPCAACFQDGKGYHQTLEQAEPTGKLLDQSRVNADQVDLEDTISQMEGEKGIRIDVWYAGRMNSALLYRTLSIDQPEFPGCPARLP